MRREEREAILRQGVTRAETARDRRDAAALAEDVGAIPLRGEQLRLRLRNFTTETDGYLASLGGPPHYMVRLREIEEATAAHLADITERYERLRASEPSSSFPAAWERELAQLRFDEVNDLIDRHNRWYPVEARLRMDPRRGDYVLVGGRDYRLERLDAAWVRARFPAAL